MPSSGALTPAEMSLLATVIDRHCWAHGIRSAVGREAVAASALAYFQGGATSEDDLLELLARDTDDDR
jgi:hypothetical protein